MTTNSPKNIKEKIDSEDIQILDEIYHSILYSLQKKKTKLFSEKLKDVTTIEISILEIIEKKPDVILKEIVEILGVPSSTLTNAINRLEKRNYVKRVISKRDRRSYGLELTGEGKIAQIEHKRGEKNLWEGILDPLDTKEERTNFLKSLKKIADSLQ
ncbi:MarR family winged helix-turn-helix transcriptional regulator [Crassaminicella profunda]|uniref:MarR family winged helix-turn-helix transcriptional regulator n=1 Tax=Crassaminicella profunda TaxID=1286698 RepID=UPI001CA71A2C|nr:MarR family transcriptional regulator [Crassaminicella profunda]QZY55069.1 MarR family transcriptional regulator [Crassaminicella profunda]